MLPWTQLKCKPGRVKSYTAGRSGLTLWVGFDPDSARVFSVFCWVAKNQHGLIKHVCLGLYGLF